MTRPKWRRGEPYSSPEQLVSDILAKKHVFFNHKCYDHQFVWNWPLFYLYRDFRQFARAVRVRRTEGAR